MFKPKRFQEALPVEYTPAELAALADQADELVSEMERLEQLKAALPKKIESIKEQVYEVSKKRKAGFRDKLVDCETVADANLPEVITTRLDTGEEIARRAMTESERQEDLFQESPAEPTTEDGQASEPTDEERARIHQDAVARWRREPETIASTALRIVTEEINSGSLDTDDCTVTASVSSEPTPQSRLTYEQLLDFAKNGSSVKNPASHARKWHLSGELDKTAEAWLAQQEHGEPEEQEAEPADTFTASKCMECGALDGAHAINCTLHPDFCLNVTPKKSRKGNSAVQPTR